MCQVLGLHSQNNCLKCLRNKKQYIIHICELTRIERLLPHFKEPNHIGDTVRYHPHGFN